MSVHRYELPPAKSGGRPRVRWRVNYELPPHPDTGKRRTSTIRGFTTERAAKERDAELRVRSVVGEITCATDKSTVANYLRVWLDGLALKQTTLAGYRMVVEKRLIPQLGGYQLSRLEPEHIDVAYRTLEREGSRTGGPLSPKSVLNAHRVLHRALKEAVQRGRIACNPASLAHPPSTKVAVKIPAMRAAERIWTPEQYQVFLEDQADDRLFGAWMLIATTGLRRGEWVGMPWDAIDLDAARCEVRQQLVLADNVMVFEASAKTPAGWRSFALDPDTTKALLSMWKAQLAERLLMGPAYQDHGLVVCWPDGRPMNPERLRRRLQSAARRLGLPVITVHGLRHSYATAALRAGVSVEVLQQRLGHEDVATTLRYAHARREDDVEAAERAARWITG